MKKVGMFLEKDFPPDPRVENEAISLIEAGYEVHLFTLNYKKGLSQKEEVNGIIVHRYHVGYFTYKLSALVYSIPLFNCIISPLIKKFLKQTGPDILHIHDMLIAEAVMKLNLGKLPVILDLHENRPAIMGHYPHTQTFPGKLMINLDQWHKKQDQLIGMADHVIVVTEEAKTYYRSRESTRPDKFVVVPNTVRLDVFNQYAINENILTRFEDNFCVLYLGDTGIRRGTITAIESIALLKNKIKGLRLVLVGQSSSDRLLRKKALKLGVSDVVVFEGWQELSLFPSYIQASDVCICPLLRNLHHDTTYANKIFQYMAIGKPLIVSDCPPQAKIVKDFKCGLVHEANNPSQLANSILELANNNALSASMGDNAKKAIHKEWNWEVKSNSLLKLYQNIASNDA